MEQTKREPVRLPSELPAIPHGTTNEKLIVGKLVTDLLAAGHTIDVDDGDDICLKRSADTATIFDALSSTDADRLIIRRNGRRLGWVYLVWGNDTDIISDYTINLKKLIDGANKLSERLS